MIFIPNSQEWTQYISDILLEHIGVRSTKDMRAILWVNNESKIVEWVVAYDGFIGKTCQMHVVNLMGKMTPKQLLWAAFDYPFNQAGLSCVMGIVNSRNTDAMRYDTKLGFKEINRLKGMHDNGGDIVLLTMQKADCRWIKERKYEKQLVAA